MESTVVLYTSYLPNVHTLYSIHTICTHIYIENKPIPSPRKHKTNMLLSDSESEWDSEVEDVEDTSLSNGALSDKYDTKQPKQTKHTNLSSGSSNANTNTITNTDASSNNSNNSNNSNITCGGEKEICPQCSESFDEVALLIAHVESVHGNTKTTTTTCSSSNNNNNAGSSGVGKTATTTTSTTAATSVMSKSYLNRLIDDDDDFASQYM